MGKSHANRWLPGKVESAFIGSQSRLAQPIAPDAQNPGEFPRIGVAMPHVHPMVRKMRCDLLSSPGLHCFASAPVSGYARRLALGRPRAECLVTGPGGGGLPKGPVEFLP